MAACGRHDPPAPPSPRNTDRGPIPALIPAPFIAGACPATAKPFVVTHATRVSGPPDVARQVERWFGLPASAVGDPATIELRLSAPDTTDPAVEIASAESQAFSLDVQSDRAVVTARGHAGLYYGAQALAQMAGARLIGVPSPPIGNATWTVPCVHIEDKPRSAFRAMHLDVSRHFFDRKTVERYVDLLSFYRFNVFHWHLTDDQGFRVELGRHPELASPDASYTRADLVSVIATARDRYVTVVPEIEMPGHARAILAAHPELSCTGEQQTTPHSWGIFDDVLCAGNPGSIALVKDILGEVAHVFPSHLLHVGGDEVPPTRWNACPKCRAAMDAAHVDAPGLEHVFMEQVFAHLATLHKRPMVWDEALPPGPPGPNAPVIVAWQGKARGDLAAQRGYDTVQAPYQSNYFNFKQPGMTAGVYPGHELPRLGWNDVRSFDPGTGPHVLGGEGALWSEFVASQHDIDILAMPRVAALADALWAGARGDFVARFTAPSQVALLDRSHVEYYIEPPQGMRPRRVLVDEVMQELAWPQLYPSGTIRYTRDGSVPTPDSPRYRDPLQITETMTLKARLFLPNGRSSPVVETKFVQEKPRPPVRPSVTGVTCTYYEGAFHRLAQIAPPETAKVVRDGIDIDDLLHALGRTRTEHFAFACRGAIAIRTTGVQRFFVKADDGARITIDGERIVDIDGELGPREEDGEIALEKGLHTIEVLYFQGTEGKELRIEVAGPDDRGKPGPLEFFLRDK